MSASARRYPPIGMDGESFFLRRWLQPAATWTAGGIMAGHFTKRTIPESVRISAKHRQQFTERKLSLGRRPTSVGIERHINARFARQSLQCQ